MLGILEILDMLSISKIFTNLFLARDEATVRSHR
jgi:hypothetical protein